MTHWLRFTITLSAALAMFCIYRLATMPPDDDKASALHAACLECSDFEACPRCQE